MTSRRKKEQERKEAEKLEQETKKCKCLKMHNFRITYPKKHL